MKALLAAFLGLALGLAVSYASWRSYEPQRPSYGLLEPSAEMAEIMEAFGFQRGAIVDTMECYQAGPYVACLTTYLTPVGPRQAPWLFRETESGLEAW